MFFGNAVKFKGSVRHIGRSHLGDENFVDGGQYFPEIIHLYALVNKVGQNVIRLAELVQLYRIGLVVVLHDREMIGGHLGGIGLLLEADVEQVLLEVLLDLLYRPVEYFAAFVHQHDVVADLFDLLHAVGGKYNGSAVPGHFEYVVLDP